MNKKQIRKKILELENRSQVLSRKEALRQKRLINSLGKGLADRIKILLSTDDLELRVAASEFNQWMREQFKDLTMTQQVAFEKVFTDIYNSTRNEYAKMFGMSFEMDNSLAKTVINKPFQNFTYSQRIYKNNYAMMDKISNNIVRLVNNKVSPEMLKQQLVKDLNITYNNADRLLRTEASRYYNAAAQDSYEAAGIKKVEWLTEKDDRECGECGPLNGKIFDIKDHPPLPLHPSCRCTILPVLSS